MSKARRARLRALLEAVKPRVVIRVKFRDMYNPEWDLPAKPRREITPLNEHAVEARRAVQSETAPAPTRTRQAHCDKCRRSYEVPAGEGNAQCPQCGRGDL